MHVKHVLVGSKAHVSISRPGDLATTVREGSVLLTSAMGLSSTMPQYWRHLRLMMPTTRPVGWAAGWPRHEAGGKFCSHVKSADIPQGGLQQAASQ